MEKKLCLVSYKQNRESTGGIQGEKSSKTRQIWEIWSQQLEHKQVQKGGRNQVSGRVAFSAGMPHPWTDISEYEYERHS